MKRRTWDAQPNATLGLEGLTGKPVATICPDDPISQAPYDQWRDQLLANAATTVEVARPTGREARLQHEQARLKKLVGELTLELQQRDEELWP
jgi:hypothetical protein